MNNPPKSLNPAQQNVDPGDPWYQALAYSSLLTINAAGRIAPGLATSWGYTNAGHTVFQLHLRSGVKFADGTPVTAAAAAASFEAWTKGTGSQWASNVSSAKAIGTLTMQVNLSSPNTMLPLMMTPELMGGDVVEPTALSNPAKLGSNTYGSGPYMLSPAQTIANNRYVYVPNPHYLDPSGRHYSKVILEVITNDNSAVNAIKSGQADLMWGNGNIAPTAQSDGLKLYTSETQINGVDLEDRTSGPLSNVLVRRALNYAVDRSAIVKSIFGGYASPNDEAGTPAFPATYDPSVANYYPYDPAKAKQLLAQAGYPHGFTLKINTVSPLGIGLVTQAVANYWSKIGVTTHITSVSQPGPWISDTLSKRFQATGFGYTVLSSYEVANDFLLPVGTWPNAFKYNDPQITSLVHQAELADGSAQTALYQKAMARAVTQGLFVVTDMQENVYIASPQLKGIDVNNNVTFLDPTRIQG